MIAIAFIVLLSSTRPLLDRRGLSRAETAGVQGGGEVGYLDSCPRSDVLRRHRDIRC